MKIVLDTDVIIAGMRSPSGASAEIIRRARRGELTLMASVSLFMEYEAKCTLPIHYQAAGLSAQEAEIFINTLASIISPVKTHYLWRPQLRDPADEMVLEAAVNGCAKALISFNQKHFGLTPQRFGIQLLLPSEFLRSFK
ncbi:putative toxin-antitoxin system toxin component, PIN family [Methylophilus sp. 13]|uniref:putative toxin-antitoxin system toxin component, PIN family n=1 Tax=Methylophilus sp. 13 TaxID=2781018 RepID=UPI00188F2F5F|nr:putative toxin-antitoxin system toxin component, PIN family [Methylophilus sp. 13]MBF5038435.1 putative toxin-antitoxin system toxin component, PIN family [Methylophilus sp. 13]